MYQALIQAALKGFSAGSGKSNGGSGKGSFGASLGNGLAAGKDATLSLGTGLVQQLKANKLKKQAEGSLPPLVDPNQAAFLSELHQKRKSIETGADFAAGMNALDASNGGTNEAILRNSGGDAGGTIQALIQSQRATDDAKNNLLGQGAGEQMQYNGMYGDLLNRMSARKMQLQMYQSQQARAEWAAKQQGASQNLMAGMARLNSPLAGKTVGNTVKPGAETPAAEQGAQTPSPAGQTDTSVLQGLQNFNKENGAPEGTTVGKVGFSDKFSSIKPTGFAGV